MISLFVRPQTQREGNEVPFSAAVSEDPRRPRGSQSGREKRRDESFQVRAKEPLGTDSELFPKIQADAGS